jgi:two-component system, LytTR family, response regulator
MTVIKAIIVDDERLARVNLRKLLLPFIDIEIVGEADSCQEAIELIQSVNPQLVFLDIQLNGETGFDLLEMIPNSIRIIFVTAFEEYAIRAFEANALDYLLKPVNPARLEISVNRLIHKEIEQSIPVKVYDYSDCIFLKLNNSTSKFIKIASILHIEPVGNYTKVLTIEGNRCLVLKTMKQWLEELPKKNFVRIHRSSIINIEYIERVEKTTTTHHKAFLKNIDTPLEISRRLSGKLRKI